MVKKKAKTSKKLDVEKIVITGLVICLILLIAYALVNLDRIMPQADTDEGVVVATVNGIPLYESDVDKRHKYLSAQLGPAVTKEFVLNHSISQMVLLQEAEKQEITIDQDKIIAGVDEWIAGLMTQMSAGQLETLLSAQNMTVEEFRNDTIAMYIDDFIVFSLFNKTVFPFIDETQFVADTTVTDEEIEAYFNENKDFYDRIDASHILVCYTGTASCTAERTKEEAQTRINEVYDKLKNSAGFEELAREFSDGPSGPNGGSLGLFGKGQMVAEFEEAAYALKYPNQFSEPIETQFGFHIIKLNAIKSDLEDYKTEISMQLQFDKQQETQQELKVEQEKALAKYIRELRAESDIRVYTARPSLSKGIQATPGIQTFSMREGEVCTENGKPIIRLFSTTTCPHCKWITDAYEETVMEYVNQGKIVAYHWELDTEDNTLTSFKETYVPEEEKNLFVEFNPRRSIPTFVFGCKYYRIGNGYEQENDLNSEKREFKAIIEKLIA